MSLAEKTIVITGGSRGLGKRMAEGFLEEGATVICTSRSEETLKDTVSELSREGGANAGTIAYVPFDVRSRTETFGAISEITSEYGTVDVLINNAGILEASVSGGEEYPVVDLSVDVWEAVIETNLTGAFLCSKAVLPNMLGDDSGRIIHISSGMGLEGRAERAAYVASKFGLEGLHQSLARELEETNVDSLILEPGGGVQTEGFSFYLDEQDARNRMDPSVIVEPAIRIAAGEGANGDRYVATEME